MNTKCDFLHHWNQNNGVLIAMYVVETETYDNYTLSLSANKLASSRTFTHLHNIFIG